MKAVRLEERTGIDSLRLVEQQSVDPRRRQVKIRLHAASLNFRDVLLVQGQYPGLNLDALTPLSDGAGEIVAVGEGVSRVKLGDRVSCNNLVHWVGGPAKRDPMAIQPGITSDGMLAEEIVVDEDGIVILPDSLSYAEAATLPCAAVTAWAALTEGGRPLRPGQTVLVQGTGGVSLFALQFAKIFGLGVIATTSSDLKAKKLHELGADHVFNYKSTPNWDEAVRHVTNGRGVDRVIEVGGPATLSRSAACTAYGGHLSFIGFLGGMEGSFDPLAILMGGLSLQAVGIGSRTHFEQLLEALAKSGTKPVIDQIFPFEDYKAAYAHLASGQHFGKIVISIP